MRVPILVSNFGVVFSLARFSACLQRRRVPAGAADEAEISLWKSEDSNTELSYAKLVGMLNQDLPNARQVNIFNDPCVGGAPLGLAKNLVVPAFVAVGNKDRKVCTSFSSSVKNQRPAD
jgi:hypothetical protein